MNIVLGRTVYFDFVCHTTAGVVSDADLLPTAEVFEEDTDATVCALTVTKRVAKTGNYRLPVVCTAVNGFEIGKSYNVIASATVGGVSSKAVVGQFVIETIAWIRGAVVADGGNTDTTFKTDLTEAVNDYHKDALIVFTSGSLINQVKKITVYNGGTKFVTASAAFTGTPNAADMFIVLVY